MTDPSQGKVAGDPVTSSRVQKLRLLDLASLLEVGAPGLKGTTLL